MEDCKSLWIILNGQIPSIEFTVEVENNGSLSFVDMLIYWKVDWSLGQEVYWKPTHTNLKLVISIVPHKKPQWCIHWHRSRVAADPDHVKKES